MNTREIEKTREALIRQWNRSYRQPWFLRLFGSLSVQTLLTVILGSLVVGAIPIVYSLTVDQTPTAVEPTQAGVWGVFKTRD
jgi:hypothetical protein